MLDHQLAKKIIEKKLYSPATRENLPVGVVRKRRQAWSGFVGSLAFTGVCGTIKAGRMIQQ
jgi:hypothetical protein